mmetsp:Transcript_103741/g.288814  ORF Transcript_103741/g.288814 Transcript_103741/m.288814 type:complete len:207 (-) Transcript_103741:34-654(-)
MIVADSPGHLNDGASRPNHASLERWKDTAGEIPELGKLRLFEHGSIAKMHLVGTASNAARILHRRCSGCTPRVEPVHVLRGARLGMDIHRTPLRVVDSCAGRRVAACAGVVMSPSQRALRATNGATLLEPQTRLAVACRAWTERCWATSCRVRAIASIRSLWDGTVLEFQQALIDGIAARRHNEHAVPVHTGYPRREKYNLPAMQH